jgi:hypothetical protein
VYVASGVPTNRRGAQTVAALGQRQFSGYSPALASDLFGYDRIWRERPDRNVR